MSERAVIVIDGDAYDQAVHDPDALTECADLAFYFKRGGTVEGGAVAVIRFTAVDAEGRLFRCQAVTTARILIAVGDAATALELERAIEVPPDKPEPEPH